MVSSALAQIAGIVQGGLSQYCEDLTYAPKNAVTYSAKIASWASSGSNAVISLSNIDSAITEILTGTKIRISPFPGVFTALNDTAIDHGVIAGIQINPGNGPIASGSSVSITKPTSLTVKGIVTGFDQSAMKVSVNASSISVTPAIGDQITTATGRVLTVTNVSTDMARAFFILLAE